MVTDNMSTEKLDNNEKISVRMKRIRKTKGLSQAEFAKTLGIKQPTLSEIEKGTYPPSESVRRIIVNQYGVNEEWLDTGRGEMISEPAGPGYEKPFPEPIQKAIEVLEKNPERAWELYALILERVEKKN